MLSRVLVLLGGAARRFRASNRGNVAMMFAVVSIPLIVAVGGVIDYSRASMVRTEMQDALDATSLALSRQSNIATMSAADMLTYAQNYFNANFTDTDVDAAGITLAPSYVSTGPSVTVTASGKVPMDFLGLIGLSKLPVNATSTPVWGQSRLRVALVLDNTGSMADDGKITALRTATTNLLTQLQTAAAVDGDVYVSIVPFVKDVNVGTSNSSASWVQFDDGTDKSFDGANGSCNLSGSRSNPNSPRSSCQALGSCSISSKTSQSTCTGAGTCSLSSYTTQSSCTGAGTCSVSGYTTQSTCTAPGTCSISGHSTPSSCTSAGTCSISGYSTSSSCQSANVCTITGKSSRNSCTSASGCFISGSYTSSYTTSSSCSSHHGTWSSGQWVAGVWSNGVWSGGGGGQWTAGAWTPGVWTSGVWTPTAHSNWNGCVTDRGASWTSGPGTSSGYDQLTTTPDAGTAGTLFPAEQYSACPQAVMGLSYDWTTLKSLVTNMAANGTTNQPIGLVWGWQSLVGGGPFGTVPALDSRYQYQQIVILLSDGLNTQDRWYGDGSHTATQVDTRMYNSNTGAGTCANVKAAGITIFAVQVDTGGDPTSTLLQNCATDSSHFFLLTSADQIVTTFNSIGTALSNLRLKG